MNKNKTKEALIDSEESLMLFFREIKWILNSNRGKNFQFMMLSRTFEAIMFRQSQIREKCLGKEPMPESPLDTY